MTMLTRVAVALAVFLAAHPVAAQTAPPAPSGPPPQGQAVAFDQYKAQQLQQLQRAQARVGQRLSDPNLPADQRQRLEHQQAQLAKFAAMPPDRQDQVLHRRFARIDANHDGVIDPAELQAFRQQHRERAEAKKDAAAAGTSPAAGGTNGNSTDNFWPSQGQSPN